MKYIPLNMCYAFLSVRSVCIHLVSMKWTLTQCEKRMGIWATRILMMMPSWLRVPKLFHRVVENTSPMYMGPTASSSSSRCSQGKGWWEDEEIKRQVRKLRSGGTLSPARGKGTAQTLQYIIYTLRRLMAISTILLSNLFAWLTWAPCLLVTGGIACLHNSLLPLHVLRALAPHVWSISSFSHSPHLPLFCFVVVAICSKLKLEDLYLENSVELLTLELFIQGKLTHLG